ncbi:MAG: hypothetical protein RBR53_07420 [Desulforegulaceae bacterium]|nr:hypothetical protein [Desulforegulaceae bacterium]
MTIIVSLATTSQRLTLCRAALISLATQSLPASKIVVNVSKEPYLRDSGIKNKNVLAFLTNGLDVLAKKTIEIRWVDNTGPYRKLIPTLQTANDNDIIVTADDDIFYGQQWLKLLLEDFDPENKIIHAARARYQRKNHLKKLTGYGYWPIVNKPALIVDDWIITYGGGAVLCKSWFSDDLLEDSNYLNVAPIADDLWYSKLCKLSGLKVKVIPSALNELNFFQHDDGLVNHNFPRAYRLLGKIKLRFIDRPLNYYKLVKFGNDIAYDAIERYFSNKV